MHIEHPALFIVGCLLIITCGRRPKAGRLVYYKIANQETMVRLHLTAQIIGALIGSRWGCGLARSPTHPSVITGRSTRMARSSPSFV